MQHTDAVGNRYMNSRGRDLAAKMGAGRNVKSVTLQAFKIQLSRRISWKTRTLGLLRNNSVYMILASPQGSLTGLAYERQLRVRMQHTDAVGNRYMNSIGRDLAAKMGAGRNVKSVTLQAFKIHPSRRISWKTITLGLSRNNSLYMCLPNFQGSLTGRAT